MKSQTVNEETGSDEWLICDTGAGVHPLQIDFYWGEDEPQGAIGRQRPRPRGTWVEYAFEVEVTAKRQGALLLTMLVPGAGCALFGAWSRRRYNSRF